LRGDAAACSRKSAAVARAMVYFIVEVLSEKMALRFKRRYGDALKSTKRDLMANYTTYIYPDFSSSS
jgi:hypothetical protein